MFLAVLATTYSYLWLLWFLLFVVIEVSALLLSRGKIMGRYEGGTLSELIWRITKTNKVVFVIFTTFFVVLGTHLFIDG